MESRISLIRFHDPVQEFRADNTTTPPDGSDVTEVEVPLVVSAPRAQKLHSLRVRNNFRCVKSVTYCIDESGPVAFEFSSSRLWQNFGRGNALFFLRRDDARFDGGINCRNNDRLFDGGLKRPDAGSLLSRFVKNHIDQRSPSIRIDLSKNLGRDFNEVAIKLAFVPFGEHVGQLRSLHLQNIFHDCIRFADQLNVAVLDAVMDHLDVVTGAIRAHVSATRFAIHLRSDLAKNGGDNLPCFARAARHQ